MGSILTGLLDRKQGGVCPVCCESHPVQNRCRHEVLAARITKLVEANKLIPQLMQANKESTELAASFYGMLKLSSESHDILMEILSRHGEVGKEIEQEYIRKLDDWAKERVSGWDKETTNPDTQEGTPLFSPEV